MLRLPAWLVVCAAVLMAASAGGVRAALDETPPAGASSTELLVFEVRGCAVCDAFHARIHPLYLRSSHAQLAPMRFVDVNEVDEAKLGLAAPIRMVPTVVLMRDGKEVDRLPGYTGATIFFQAVAHMLSRAD